MGIAGVTPYTSTMAGNTYSRARRNVKDVKALEAKRRYVFGHDVYMDRLVALCSKALVGQLEYVSMGKKELVEWATTHWKPLLNYVPTISLPANR